MTTETVAITQEEYQAYQLMKTEIETLRKTSLYQRLAQFLSNIQKKKFTREDLGF